MFGLRVSRSSDPPRPRLHRTVPIGSVARRPGQGPRAWRVVTRYRSATVAGSHGPSRSAKEAPVPVKGGMPVKELREPKRSPHRCKKYIFICVYVDMKIAVIWRFSAFSVILSLPKDQLPHDIANLIPVLNSWNGCAPQEPWAGVAKATFKACRLQDLVGFSLWRYAGSCTSTSRRPSSAPAITRTSTSRSTRPGIARASCSGWADSASSRSSISPCPRFGTGPTSSPPAAAAISSTASSSPFPLSSKRSPLEPPTPRRHL